ncbi:MAG: glutamate ligase domain-containing protein, partial [Candidatus Kapaibacteriota bacterium]
SSYRLTFGGDIPEFQHGEFQVVSPLIGRFNVENTAIAASLAHIIGIETEVIQQALKGSEGAPGRMQRIRLPNGALVLVDYAHTPDALEKSLSTCKALLNSTGKGRLTVVFGCGGVRDKAKRPVMGKLAAELADNVIITDDNPRNEPSESIINDILLGVDDNNRHKVQSISDRLSAITHALKQSEDREVILIAGKGHEEYQIIGQDIIPFSDLGTVKQLISKIFLSQGELDAHE